MDWSPAFIGWRDAGRSRVEAYHRLFFGVFSEDLLSAEARIGRRNTVALWFRAV